MIVLKILLWLLLILLAFILLVLVAPIGYQVNGRVRDREKTGVGQLSLFWGLIRLKTVTEDFRHLLTTLTVAGFSKTISTDTGKKNKAQNQTVHQAKITKAATLTTAQKQKKKDPRTHRKKSSLSFSQVREHLQNTLNREVIASIRRFLQKIWKALRPQVFHIHVVYGLPDPYETAVINNVVLTLFAVWPHRTLHLEPVFQDSLLDATGTIKGSLVPIAFLAAALQLVLSKPIRRIWWPLVKQHRKKSSSRSSEAFNSSSGASST